MIQYVGNGPYCYANATSMLLSSIGESVPPAQLEVLTGVGLGAFWVKEPKLLIFSNLSTAPDQGTSKALRILGFDFEERWSEDAGSPPFEGLRTDLAGSPAVLGPLDMGYLTYNPIHRTLGGADHFVVAYDMDDREIRLHDPDGFPHVSLPLEQMERAWRAERIPYRRGWYRYWTAPRRVHRPHDDEIYDEALRYFQTAYRKSERWATRENWTVGREAILTSADHVRRGHPSQDVIDHMVLFAFKLGARRAIDYATFFDAYDRELAAMKRRHAELFGSCHTLAASKRWTALADTLQKLADEEEGFRVALLAR